MDRKSKIILITLLISTTILIIISFVILTIMQKRAINKLSPPNSANSFEEFINNNWKPVKLFIAEEDKVKYIIWIGETAPEYCAPSGPSVYVFNINGQLLYWSPTTFDNEPGTEFVRDSYFTDSIDKTVVLDIINNRTK